MRNKITIFSLIMFTVAFVGAISLAFSLKNLDRDFYNQSQKVLIRIVSTYAHNIDEVLNKDIKRLYEDGKYRQQVATWLSTLVSEISRYIFIAYRDKEGKYRYLVDGSKEDRGEFGQKIDVDKRFWNRAYESGEDLFFFHRLETLWITYLHPIKRNGQVQAILAIDFEPSFLSELQKLFKPVQTIAFALFSLLLLSIIVLLLELYHNFKLHKLSFFDSLTQIYNRAFLREFIDRIDIKDYAILMLDIDHFKKINDTYGHKAGDMVLKEFARRIKNHLRKNDVFVRFGGEEFLVFLKRGNEGVSLVEVAQRLRKAIESEDFDIGAKKIHVTVSIGMFLRPEYARSISEAIKRADELLYEAKRGGRNQVVWSDEREDNRSKEIEYVREAIEEGRIFCLYQPIVDSRDGKVVKYEALVRLRDKDGTIIAPGAFLDAIYYTTVYHQLTKEVLKEVFDTIASKGVFISINLNFSDIKDNTIFELIFGMIQKNQKLASFLTIEILENEPFEESERIKKRIDALKGLGVGIALDDFGKGYSNFEIFNYFPIDILKIDGSIVKSVASSKIGVAILQSVKTFADAVGAKVVAEFVESEEIKKRLLAMGIYLMQGYYFSPPLEKEKIEPRH